MGFWAGIKYALNSTLGTENFKPLNEIIIGEKRFVANDTTLKIVYDSRTIEFNPKIGGTIRIISKSPAPSTTTEARIKMSGNDGSIQYGQFFNIPYQVSINVLSDFNIEPNIVYTFQLEEKSTAILNPINIQVCGQVTDYGYFS